MTDIPEEIRKGDAKPKGTRKGYTTGACSAAAARAATLGLITGAVPEFVECTLPNGQVVRFAVSEGAYKNGWAHAVVIKDAGDDPDVTDKAHLTADVRRIADYQGIRLLGGAGVGTVTMAGLGLTVGNAAINPVPCRNIMDNVRAVGMPIFEAGDGIEVIISVPGGEQMAEKTLNARLGIIGGISILGTTGIVHPYSTAAFRASVIQGIEVAARQGQDTVVLTTGGRTEKFVMRELPQLSQACFVQMGDFLRYALDTVVAQGIQHVVIGGMVGKLTKMAQGETITHANRNPVDTELVADIAAAVGAPAGVCAEIRAAETARFGAEKMEELGLAHAFHVELGRRVIATLVARYPNQFTLRVLICDFEGNKLAEVTQ